MKIQLNYWKTYKMMLLKCCTQYASKFGKLSSGHRTGKWQFSFHSQKNGNPKECSNYCAIALISHASKVMLKILQARFQQYVNHELPDVQGRFRKGRGTRDQIANIHWFIEKASSRKIPALLTIPKTWTVWITTNSGKFLKRWEYQTSWPASWETYMHVRKQQLEPDTTNWFQIGKGVCQGCILSPCLFNLHAESIMRNA